MKKLLNKFYWTFPKEITLFHKDFDKSHFNYLCAYIHFPHFTRKLLDEYSGEDCFIISLDADSQIYFGTGSYYKSFTFKLLGFGATLSRQWGY